MADRSTLSDGHLLHIEHDGFLGTVQGAYTTREGKRGLALQLVGAKVMHVYGERWFDPVQFNQAYNVHLSRPVEGPTKRETQLAAALDVIVRMVHSDTSGGIPPALASACVSGWRALHGT